MSSSTFDARAGRIGAALTAALLGLYGLTEWLPLLLFVVADYAVRALTPWTAPLGLVARMLRDASGAEPLLKNEGPKLFAWRVGVLMAVIAFVLVPLSPAASVGVALLLAAFSALDGVLNLCVGCLLYTHAVFPLLRPNTPLR